MLGSNRSSNNRIEGCVDALRDFGLAVPKGVLLFGTGFLDDLNARMKQGEPDRRQGFGLFAIVP